MNKFYKFSDFLLDPQSLAFYRQSVPVQLSSRAFQILEYLIERRGAALRSIRFEGLRRNVFRF